MQPISVLKSFLLYYLAMNYRYVILNAAGGNFITQLTLTLIGMSYENKKIAHLQRHQVACFISLN